MKTILALKSLPALMFICICIAAGCDSGTKTETKSDDSTNQAKADNVPEIKDPGGQCGEDLKIYVEEVDKLIANATKANKEGDTDEMRAERDAIGVRLDELGKKMEAHQEVLMNPECARAWGDAQMRYTKFIQENMQNMMPKSK